MPCSYCLETDCFYDKKYCRNIVNKGMVDELGRAVILEELRQYFAFQFYPELWWKYML